MAELAITIQPQAGCVEGDLWRCWNRGGILAAHAHNILFARNERTRRYTRALSSGLLAANDPMRDWFEQTHEFSITRVSRTQAVKRRISDGAEILVVSEKLYTDFDGKPNCSMHIPLLFDRQVATLTGLGGNGCPLFGTPELPTFYYGKIRVDTGAASRIWTAIESKLGHDRRDAKWTHYPAGHNDLRRRLHIVVDEFDDAKAADLLAPQMDLRVEAVPIVLAERRHAVVWRGTLGLDAKQIEDVADKRKAVDLRGVLPTKLTATIVTSKGDDLTAIVAGGL